MSVATSPDQKRCWLVLFTYDVNDDGSAFTTQRYTSWTNDVTVGGFTWQSEPLLAVTPGMEDGTSADKPWYVTMPLRTPADSLVSPFAHSQVAAQISEWAPFSGEDPQLLWTGIVTKATANSAGSKGLSKLEVSGWRTLIQYPLGLQSNPDCAWALGDANCQVDVASLAETVVVDVIEAGTLIHLVAAPSSAKTFIQGSMELNGCKVTVVARDGVSGVKWLVDEPPPPSWAGQAVTMKPGCDGTPQVCLAFYDNIDRFMGCGVAIPEYNPLIGSPLTPVQDDSDSEDGSTTNGAWVRNGIPVSNT
jgi:hypothetical protein